MGELDQIINDITTELENLLNVKIEQSQYCIPIFSDELSISPWAIIHVIDYINKKYNIIFDASDIATNPIFSIDNFAQSIYRQLLLKINT